MELRVLGPLEVCVDGAALPLGARKQQIVLALLAVNVGNVVSVDELVDELWPEHPPPSAVANVRSYAANLRRVFESLPHSGLEVVRHGHAYQLESGGTECDLTSFRAEFTEGVEALRANDPGLAATRLTKALGRWRGRMLGTLPLGPQLNVRVAAAEEERLRSVESLAEAYLAMGDPTPAIGLLREHVGAHPLREPAHALLMRALYGAGDPAGALRAYADARAMLVEELGVEPGPQLRQLHREMLDPDGGRRPQIGDAVPAASVAVARPRELPPDIGCLVGRDDEKGRVLRALIEGTDAGRPRPAIVVIHGAGGAGKSALAVRAAHEAAEHFPDGQLYVDLFGSTPGVRSLTIPEVLRHLLCGLGVGPHDIPPSENDAAARFRTLTAHRRLLVVLDNAEDAAGILAVLPASGAAGVIVTSRRPLVSVDAELRVRLAGLPEADGLDLLARLTGNTRVDPTVASRILGLCDNLPLAVRIVAGRLASRPDLPAEELAELLADRDRRLDELELEGLAVRACVRAGYDAVASNADPRSQLAARAFRALGLLNTPDMSVEAVAAMLAGPDIDTVKAALDRLVNVELVEPVPAGRYRLHDLVRLVAAELASETDVPAERERVLYRAVAYYAAGMSRARERLTPGRLLRTEPDLTAEVRLPDLAREGDARKWMETEYQNVLAAIEQAGQHGGRLARMILWCVEALWHRGYMRHDWGAIDRLVGIVHNVGQQWGEREASAWADLARGRRQTEEGGAALTGSAAALRSFNRALAGYAAVGNWEGVALAHIGLGIASQYQGQHTASIRHFSSCLDISSRHGLPSGEALALVNLGVANVLVGRLGDALNAARTSLARRQAAGDVQGMGAALYTMTVIHAGRGELEEGITCASDALARGRHAGDQMREHEMLTARSELFFRAGRFSDAMRDAEAALSLADGRGHGYISALAELQRMKAVAARDEKRRSEAEAARQRALTAAGPRDLLLDWLLLDQVPTGPHGQSVS